MPLHLHLESYDAGTLIRNIMLEDLIEELWPEADFEEMDISLDEYPEPEAAFA